MSFIDVYLGLGSNLGDRKANLLQALERLDAALGKHYSALSSIMETPAMGFDGAAFLNAGVRYRLPERGDVPAETAALKLLAAVKTIEREMGRTAAPLFDAQGKRVYHDRIIDIDILFYGTWHIDLPQLTVPHPRIAERPFVTVPLSEIAKPALKAAFPEIFA